MSARLAGVRLPSMRPLGAQFSYACALAVPLLAIMLVHHEAVPYSSEYIYLLTPYKMFHPDFLLNDWTFSSGWGEHLVFNAAAGLLMLVFPLQVVGWLGRLLCWSLTIVALLRLGRHLGIPPLMVALAIVLWLAPGQQIVGNEWIFRGFEAKPIAYVFLLFAMDRFLAERDGQGAVLLGLCFSFHPSVGFAGALAVGAGLLFTRPWRRLVWVSAWSLLFALPGIVPALPMVAGGAAGAQADWRFLTLVAMPVHLDAATFPARAVFLLYLLLIFSCLQYWANRDNRVLRFLVAFEITLAVIFAGGLVARFAGWFEPLKVFPFRLFPIFAPLLFLLLVMRAFRDRATGKPRALAAVVALVGLMGLGDPVAGFHDQLGPSRSDPPLDGNLRRTFLWISEHTPNGSVAVLPPWPRESFYLARRAQIANWAANPYDRIANWRARMEAMLGPFDWKPTSDEAMERRYAQLTESQIAAIVGRYGGDYLVSETRYTYPVLFDSGTYKVYALASVKARANAPR